MAVRGSRAEATGGEKEEEAGIGRGPSPSLPRKNVLMDTDAGFGPPQQYLAPRTEERDNSTMR